MAFVKLEVRGVRHLKNAPRRMRKGALKGVTKGMKFVRDKAKKFDGSNQLRIRTGRLRDSIDYEIKQSRDEIVGFLGSDAIYAAIQEYGGTVTARKAKYLVFKTSSGWRKVESITIPPRPFLRPAILNNKDDFENLVRRGIKSGWGYGVL